MSRKKMDESEKKVRLPVCVKPNIRFKLEARAASRGMTLSQYCALVLGENVEKGK